MGKCGPTIADPPNRSQDELTTSASATRLKKVEENEESVLITSFYILISQLGKWTLQCTVRF
jgi:hypothetical protein